MRIDSFEIEDCVQRKDDPTWRFALAASASIEGLIVRLVSEDGYEGYGYASATPHMGAVMEGLRAELAFLKPVVMGRDARSIEGILQDMGDRLKGAPQAKAAIDCALHDLVARSRHVPVNELLGGPVRKSIPILRILAIKSPADMAKQARRLVDQGYLYLKIKVEGDVGTDVARVAAIRQEVGEAVHLTIDANQAYSVKTAIQAINRMVAHGIELVEQPVAAEDLEGLKLVTASVPVTVEADEAAGSLAQIYDIVTNRRADAVSLKIPKLGGLRNTLAAARICEVAGVEYRLGAAVGSRLLAAHALHLACALPQLSYACELGEFDRLLDDPFGGIEVVDGTLTLPEVPGYGVRQHTSAEDIRPGAGAAAHPDKQKIGA